MIDWDNIENEFLQLNESDVLNGLPYSESSDLQKMLFHIVKILKSKVSK